MYCPKCGKQVDDNATFCPYCVSPIVKAGQAQEQAHEQAFEQATEQAFEKTEPTKENTSNNEFSNSPFVFQQGEAPHGDYNTAFHLGEKPKPDYPMKWYKFLTRFLLIAIAVVTIIGSIQYFTGSVYDVYVWQDTDFLADLDVDTLDNMTTLGEIIDFFFAKTVTHEEMYEYYPRLHAIAIIIGVLDVLFACCIIYTEVMLVKFKKRAPMCMYIVIGLYYIRPLTQWALTCIAGCGTSILYNLSSFIFDIGLGALFIFLHYRYFKTREELFCN